MAKLLGIDVGTSGCKVLLIDDDGLVLKQASAEYPISVPKPLWSEQQPEDWWHGVVKCLEEIGEPSPDAIGVTGQMHGAVFLDAKDEVIRPAILWNDQRTVRECEEIDERVGKERVRSITCNPPLTGFQLPKLLWLRNNEPGAYSRLRSLLLPKDYIRFKLTGQKATEVTDASGTGALDVPSRRWSGDLLEAVDVKPDLFPDCYESAKVSARTVAGAGLNAGIPVVGGGGDQAAAAVGTGAVVPGVMSVSLGTSGVVFTAVPKPKFDPGGAAHTFCHANGAWHAMGVMLSCGGAVRWYRDVLGGGKSYDQLTAEAETAPVGSNGLIFLPYLTGERCPYNDPFAKATFAGGTLANGHADFSRAVFEGVSLGLLDAFELLVGLGATSGEVRVNGGGAKSLFWVQMLADMFKTACFTLAVDEGPAFGAAILAGVGVGVWPDVSIACTKTVRMASRSDPTGVSYKDVHRRYGGLYQSLREWNRSELI